MPDFSFKMNQIQFLLTALPDPVAGFRDREGKRDGRRRK